MSTEGTTIAIEKPAKRKRPRIKRRRWPHRKMTAAQRREHAARRQFWSWEAAYERLFAEIIKSPRLAKMTPKRLVAYCAQAADAYAAEANRRRPKSDD